MGELTLKLLEMSLHGAALILSAALLRTLLLRFLPKRLLRLLWVPALLVLLVPLPAVFSLRLPLPEPVTVAPLTETLEVPAPAEAPEIGTEKRAAETAEPLSPRTGPGLLPLIWVTGAGVMGAAFLVLYLWEYRRLRYARPIRSREAEAWLQAHPTRRKLCLRYLPGIHSPLTYGFIRPVILLPERPDWEDPDTAFALEHEFVHVRRWDAARKLLLHLVLALHWFNPAVWLMYRLYNRDLELGCDEAVLLRLGADRRAEFAGMLVSAVKKRSLAPFPGLGAGAVKERVAAILDFRGRGRLRRCLALALVLLLLSGAFCTLGVEEEMLYRSGDLTLAVPADLADLLLVEMPALTGAREEVLFRVYELETQEAAKALYPDSDGDYGLLFTINRTDEELAGDYLRQNVSGKSLLARDTAGYYYFLNRKEGGALTPPDTEDKNARWERRMRVNRWVLDLRSYLRWNTDLRSRYPAYSTFLSSWFADFQYGSGKSYKVSRGKEGTYQLWDVPGMEALVSRLTWELLPEAAKDIALPEGGAFTLTRGAHDRMMQFWAGSDLVLVCSDLRKMEQTRCLYRVTLMDAPGEKVGDLVEAWYEGAKAAAETIS